MGRRNQEPASHTVLGDAGVGYDVVGLEVFVRHEVEGLVLAYRTAEIEAQLGTGAGLWIAR